jgi:hypothetical protein
MTIFDFISLHQLSQLSPEEAKDATPYGLLLGLGACTVYTNHSSIWVVVENEGPLFRVRLDELSYGGPKGEQHATLANFGKVEKELES